MGEATVIPLFGESGTETDRMVAAETLEKSIARQFPVDLYPDETLPDVRLSKQVTDAIYDFLCDRHRAGDERYLAVFQHHERARDIYLYCARLIQLTEQGPLAHVERLTRLIEAVPIPVDGNTPQNHWPKLKAVN